MTSPVLYAPGWPGIAARWTSSAKTGIGTALAPQSRAWFAVSHGILNEIYYPRVDQACTRDLGLLVTAGADFFSEEKRDSRSQTAWIADGVPAYRLTNTCTQGRYRIEKEILTDPADATLLQRTRFEALVGACADYRLHVLLAPHLANHGGGNTAWLGDFEGRPMLFAERDGSALALACSIPWRARSVGFVGVSDGWQDLSAHKRMTWFYERAENGNVALCGQVDLEAGADEFVIAVGFGTDAEDAARRASASLVRGFDDLHQRYVGQWKAWQASLHRPQPRAGVVRDLRAISAAVLRTCESKQHAGGVVASLSIPWGFAKGDDDLGGYHLVWPRDLVEAAGGLLAAGAVDDVRRVLDYLADTQSEDGHWPQNMWIDGRPYWQGVQLDETAFPILLVGLVRRWLDAGDASLARLWPMVRRAATYLVVNGPVTAQDRWEEDPGYSPFTLAVTIAALLVAADLADAHDEAVLARYLRETADCWNECIERWTYVVDTELARFVGVDGYYVRIASPDVADCSSPAAGFVPIKNRPVGQSQEPAGHIISPDALALVRFGLRTADDPRIVNTVRVIDALLKVDTPKGPAWHRYNGDGYGEHADGAPFDGTGIGRVWPLLTGERAHYELAAGRTREAARLCGALESFANEGGMMPEQVWDSPDVAARELFFGSPSGSAMPLVWAHAEYLKLCRSLEEGCVFDMPELAQARYARGGRRSRFAGWRLSGKRRCLPAGKVLRVETTAPATVHWSDDGWRSVHDLDTRDTTAGMQVADLPTADLAEGSQVLFTLFWRDAGRWEGEDFAVQVVAASDS